MSTHTSSFHGITITVEDATDEILQALEKAKARGLKAVGMSAETHAQGVIMNSGRVDTGRMFNSVGSAVDGDDVYVGANVDYAIYNELGTVRMKGIHFLQKAATEHTPEYRSLIKESLKNA